MELYLCPFPEWTVRSSSLCNCNLINVKYVKVDVFSPLFFQQSPLPPYVRSIPKEHALKGPPVHSDTSEVIEQLSASTGSEDCAKKGISVNFFMSMT